MANANAQKDTMIWLTDDQRDIDAVTSSKPIATAADTVRLIYNALSNVNIKMQLTSIPRMNVLLDKMDDVCVINRVKTTQREQENEFSLPLNLYLGYRLYFLPENRPNDERYINELGQLMSLAEFLISTEYKTIGISKGRSFGKYLDEEIAKIPDNHVILRPGEQRYYALPEMLMKGRFEYVIDFPNEMKKRLDVIKAATLNSMEIANTPPYILGHIACSKTERGKQHIDKINGALLSLYQSESFWQAHASHTSSIDLPTLTRYFNQVFKPATH